MPIPTHEDTPGCAWCGELLETTDNQAEMGRPIGSVYEARRESVLVHAEPCSIEAQRKGWTYA